MGGEKTLDRQSNWGVYDSQMEIPVWVSEPIRVS